MPLYQIEGMKPSLPDDQSSWVAPTASVIGDARIGRHVGVWFGAVIRADNTTITIGDRTNIQEGAMLHSDAGSPLTIGSGVTVGHHAILHGCTVGDNVLVGMNATILNNAVIGEGSLIGAGALVTENKVFPPNSLIVGVPAKAVRTLNETEIAALEASARGYAQKQSLFSTNLHALD